MRNQVGLVAYADRFGGSLESLDRLLRGPLAGLFGSVHLLPFFTPYDGADAGFDPEDHTRVDPRLGTWDDVRRIGAAQETVVDVIVNHVSTQSPEFTDWVQRGDASPYAGMFLTLSTVFPTGATEEQLLRIYRPRPGLPFTPVTLRDGSRRLLWTTFMSRQADLDVRHDQTRRYLGRVIERLADSGVAMLRLDAVGYAVKTPGTSCFMTPETFAFIDEITAMARARRRRPRRSALPLPASSRDRAPCRPGLRLRGATIDLARAVRWRQHAAAAMARRTSAQRGHGAGHA